MVRRLVLWAVPVIARVIGPLARRWLPVQDPYDDSR